MSNSISTHQIQMPSTGYLRLPQVLTYIPVSATTLWRWCREGRFPQPIKLTERVTAWRTEDVQTWIKSKSKSEVQS